MLKLFLSVLLMSQVQVRAQSSCPGTTVQIGGSSTVDPLAEKWIEGYKSVCTSTTLVLNPECGSSCGARRVCDQRRDTDGIALDVGDMSRDWKVPAEATSDNGYLFKCASSNREVIQVDVALDGLSIVVATGGVAFDCIQRMGGLTMDQLRWIFTGYSESQLQANGWSASSIPNSDGNSSTHLWSELNSGCEATEILISGADKDSGKLIFCVISPVVDSMRSWFFYPLSQHVLLLV